MGMSTKIVAFVSSNDPIFQKHWRIWTMCRDERVSLPKETEEYFRGCDSPEDKLTVNLVKGQHYTDYHEDMVEGFEVDITKLPPGVQVLRFYNSF